MTHDKGFKYRSWSRGFVTFVDIVANLGQLKNLDIAAQIMVVDRFLKPCSWHYDYLTFDWLMMTGIVLSYIVAISPCIFFFM